MKKALFILAVLLFGVIALLMIYVLINFILLILEVDYNLTLLQFIQIYLFITISISLLYAGGLFILKIFKEDIK